MQLSNNKGFLLVDSLICVFVTSMVCATCYAVFFNITNYEKGYIDYQERSNENIENIYDQLHNCEVCEINESD